MYSMMTLLGKEEVIKVYPSGGVFWNFSKAIFPPAPGWFSMMTRVPKYFSRKGAIPRASKSSPPPAEEVTTSFIGFTGYSRQLASLTISKEIISPKRIKDTLFGFSIFPPF